MSQTGQVVGTREDLVHEVMALRQAVRELYGCVVHGRDGCGPHDYQDDAAGDPLVDEHGNPLLYPVESYLVDRHAQAAAMRAVEAIP